jgi:hypothetical protein
MDAVAGVIAESGAIRGLGERVVDSTVLFDAVARQSTIQMLIWQIAKVRRLVGDVAELVDALPGGAYYKPRSRPDIDWTDQNAKDELVSVLVNDAHAIIWPAERAVNQMVVVTAKDHERRERAADAVGLLALLAGQDVEPAEGSDGTDGRWRIARKVAPDRVISTVDPEARHARKSRAARADGYKAHLVAEPQTGLITAAKLTRAAGPGSSDAAAGLAMLAPDVLADGQITAVYADSAYDQTGLLDTLARADVAAIIKPRPLPQAVAGGYTIDDFTAHTDPDSGKLTAATCPAEVTVKASASARVDFRAHCPDCPLKNKCTTSAQGRVITLSPDALTRRAHRAKARTPEFKTSYRQTRPKAETAIAWMTRHLRRLPYRGETKNNAAWLRRAGAVNLKRLCAMEIGRAHV